MLRSEGNLEFEKKILFFDKIVSIFFLIFLQSPKIGI